MYPVVEMYPGLRDSYLSIVSRPMELQTVQTKLDSGRYTGLSGFATDVHLVFDNALLYNQETAVEVCWQACSVCAAYAFAYWSCFASSHLPQLCPSLHLGTYLFSAIADV